jgi:hypothetical protein
LNQLRVSELLERERVTSQLQSSIRRSELKPIVIELYRVNGSDYSGRRNCDTADDSNCETVNCVTVRASVE